MNLLSNYSNTEDIRRVIEARARAYVPEWRFNEDDPDGGTALALAFADMFGETAERLGRVPYRYFIYFLNMLETKVRSVSPATGLVSFTLTSNAERGRIIPEKTQLYANVNTSRGESTRVVFETVGEITAVPATLTQMYGVDPRHDVINALDFNAGGAKLFYADFDNNLQAHRFSIWHGDVLNLKNPARVAVKLESAFARYEGGKNTEKLINPEFATWSYVRDGVSEAFSRVYVNEGAIMLELEGTRKPAQEQPATGPAEPAELDLQPHIVCQVHPGQQEPGIMADSISLGSAYLYPDRSGVHVAPDYVYYNDISLKPNEPGYLFGKEPMKYDSLLISCDEAFSKRGARIDLTFVMHTVIREHGEKPDGPVYKWDGRFIIDKEAGEIVTPDNMYIDEVVWEYWNNVGWAHLEVESSSLNPFKSDDDVRHESLSFVCPEDMTPGYQNSIWGCWIRARIISVENPYSQFGRWQLPFAESISFNYDYGTKLKNAQTLRLENNAESYIVEGKEIGQGINLYKPLPYPEHAIYMAFDKKPAGFPVSVYVGLDGTGGKARTLSYERLIKDPSGKLVFRACKALDETNGLKDSGVISIYVPDDLVQGSIYGQEGYWLRMVDGDLRYSESDSISVLNRIELNAAQVVQQQSVENEYYSTELFESNKMITLLERPILSCEVFVDEKSVAGGEQSEEERGKPGDTSEVSYEYDEDGSVLHAWVKWRVVPSLAGAGADERVVSLDAGAGVLRFGDGNAGRVPPEGTQNIRVNYSYGGGAIGNIPAGGIAGLSASILTVADATNFTSTGGGSDNVDMKVLEKIGPARIHHRGRAVTRADFENLILEEFPEVALVRAFAGINPSGQRAPSFVTVVILPKDADNREQVLKLCKNAYRYLTQRAHCELLAARKLAVVPAMMMTVSSIIEAVAEDITYAAATERAIINAVTERLTGEASSRIGQLPSIADIFDCLRGIPNLSYVDRISLEGQYYEGGKQIITALGKPDEFPFACARNGTHVVRF